jgi:hypothetical protein
MDDLRESAIKDVTLLQLLLMLLPFMTKRPLKLGE